MKVASFFSGCGGLDLGFEQAGFDVVWANEFDSSIHDTYRLNHPKTTLCTKDVREVTAADLPNVDGFIGGLTSIFQNQQTLSQSLCVKPLAATLTHWQTMMSIWANIPHAI